MYNIYTIYIYIDIYDIYTKSKYNVYLECSTKIIPDDCG